MSASSNPTTPSSLEAAADAAAAGGDAATARWLLEQVTAAEPARAEPWLKLAAMARAQGDTEAALEAVSGALRVEPLAFLPLLMKARLLLALGREDEAGETFGYALAQRPEKVPADLVPAIADAERRHAAYQARKLERLGQATGATEAGLSAAERRRLERFRSNIVRRTRVYHSEPTHFHYPGLTESEFHEPDQFPWLAAFASATDAIHADFERVMAAERAELVPYIQYPDGVPLRQWAQLNHNRAWTAIHLIQNGAVIEANARHCSATMALLGEVDGAAIPGMGPNAMFSLLAPGAHIPPHNGVANTRLVCHVPLVVPPGCWFRVGAERREWQPGEPFVFDDTIEHEAANEGRELRVVLIFDLWHPGLSPGERQGVAAAIRASGAAPGGAGL